MGPNSEANFAKEDPMERITGKEIVEPMQKRKFGKATEPSKAGGLMIVSSGESG